VEWWANGWVVCERPAPDLMGDRGICALRDMLERAAPSMSDRIFFVNKVHQRAPFNAL
jgi:hypothetical protein